VVYSFWCDVCLAHLSTGVTVLCQNYLRPSQFRLNKDHWLQVMILKSVSSVNDDICKMGVFEKCQTQDLSNCIKAYAWVQIFLENSDQDINSNWNPDISLYRTFNYPKKSWFLERYITGLRRLNLPAAAQKLGLVSTSDGPLYSYKIWC